jgi:phosphoribosylformimino-5-aminoimidazole carboxamide ribotide isomerase
MTRFRPCVDLHAGKVKQIVGGTLTTEPGELKLYRQYDLSGGHVVMLGPGNEDAAKEALSAWPGVLHVAGGITDKNAQYWIDAGAEKVSYLMTLPLILASVPLSS